LLISFLQFTAIPNSCSGAGSREIRRFVGGRVQGIALPVPSLLHFFQVKGIKETHNCTPYAKWGVVSPEVLLNLNLP